jgi:hypothetical protein
VRPARLLPARGGEGFQGLFQLGAGRHLGAAEGGFRVAAIAEEAQRQAHAADLEGLGLQRGAAFAQDHFGGASADVHHETPAIARRHQPRHAHVDQARFLAARDHLDGVAQHHLGPPQESVAVARLAQGLGGHGPHLTGAEAVQAFGKAGQAGQSAQGGLFGEHAFGIQAASQAHGFLDVVEPAVLAAFDLADLQAEAVRSHVDGREQRAGL